MAKNDAKTETPAAATKRKAALRLGDSVQVKVAPGVLLINNESGAYFEPDVPTPQTVTATLLRRLADGDLTLA